MSKKKLLISEAFEQGKRESGRSSKSGIAYYLSLHFLDNLKFEISDKTFIRYYNALIRDGNEEKNIDTQTLDKISEYLGFKNFNDFCKTETYTKTIGNSSSTSVRVSIGESEMSLTEKIIQIVINFTPIFKIPEFLTKHSNLGIIGVILCGGLVVGGKLYKADDKTPEIINRGNRQGFLTATKQCMYWNGKEYIPEYCNDTKDNLIAIDPKKVANFKKITQPDTIKSVKGIWYSKYQNEVEFFTNNGVNPENESDLRPLTYYILEKYGKRE